MAKIDRASERGLERLEDKAKAASEERQQLKELAHLLQRVKDKQAGAGELGHIRVQDLPPQGQSMLAQFLADALRGQLPAQIARMLIGGNADPGTLGTLLQRFASSANPDALAGRPVSPDLARDLATDPSMPQQALRWAQFVQATQHVPGGGVQGRPGSATPKGEMATLAELLGQRLTGSEGAGLRTPKLVPRGMDDASPLQRGALLRATFGEAMGTALEELGILDPLHLVRAGATPELRDGLSRMLNIPRARLLGMLMHAEMLKIGPGQRGEIGIRPDLLLPLREAGVAMLGTLAALRGLSQHELDHIYKQLRHAAGGFHSVTGQRPPVKRDLIHWARTAARKRSDILLGDLDPDTHRPAMGRADAQELIAAWYYESLLYQQLAEARRRQEERERELREGIQRDERDQREREHRERQQRHHAQDDAALEEALPELEYDEQRTDQLMCFWITDYNTNPALPGSQRRMYVCVDPASGAIIPQHVEVEGLSRTSPRP